MFLQRNDKYKGPVGGRGEGKPTGGWREGQGRLEKPRTRWGRRAGRGKVRKVGGSRLNRNLQMMDRGAGLYPSDDVPPWTCLKQSGIRDQICTLKSSIRSWCRPAAAEDQRSVHRSQEDSGAPVTAFAFRGALRG